MKKIYRILIGMLLLTVGIIAMFAVSWKFTCAVLALLWGAAILYTIDDDEPSNERYNQHGDW